MTITRGVRQWATAGIALVVLTACAANIAGVAEPVPAAERSGVSPVPVSDSSASAPETTGPETSEPATSESETAPETSEPETTEPETTESETTEPETTEPETTEPGTTTTRSTTPPTTASTVRSSTATTGSDGMATARLAGSGAIVISRGTPKVTVDVFEEPLCPPCGTFSQQFGRKLDAAVTDGRIALRYRVVTFLDAKSPSGDYSTRALAALVAVAGIDGHRPGVFLAFQSSLFDPDTQPDEGAAKDLTNAQLAVLAEKAGVSDTAIAAFGTDSVVNIAVQASAGNQAALGELGVDGVPAVAVDGKVVDHRKADWLTRALDG